MGKEIFNDSIPKIKIAPSSFTGYGAITINRKEFGGLIGEYVEIEKLIVSEYNGNKIKTEVK